MGVWPLKEQAVILSLAIDAQAKVTFTNGFDMNTQTEKALKMAMAFAAKFSNARISGLHGENPITGTDIYYACREALESQEQEPVASQMSEPNKMVMLQPNGIVYENNGNSWNCIGRLVKDVDALCEEYYNRGKRCAHPAQPLSDEEIAKLTEHGYADESDLKFARAIEKAIMEKNK